MKGPSCVAAVERPPDHRLVVVVGEPRPHREHLPPRAALLDLTLPLPQSHESRAVRAVEETVEGSVERRARTCRVVICSI